MIKNLVFLFYLFVCCHTGWTQQSHDGYSYDKPGEIPLASLPGINQPNGNHLSAQHQAQSGNEYYQELRPPPLTNEAPIQFGFGQQSLQYNQNSGNFPQQSFSGPSSNFGLPNQGFVNNANVGSSQLSSSGLESVQEREYRLQNQNRIRNNLDQSGQSEPIIGQFKPELVDLNNGGPLNRMITTCGPNNDCKTIFLQSDLNRELGVLGQQNNDNNQGFNDFHTNEIQGSTNNADFRNGDGVFRRPPRRRLIPYTEIPHDDIYN